VTFVSGGFATTLLCGVASVPTTYRASLTSCTNGTCSTGCCIDRKLNLNGTVVSGATVCQPAGETTVFTTTYASTVAYFANQTVAVTSTCPAATTNTNTTTGSSSSFIKASVMMVFALVAAMFF
jgi:hypothetical protein